MVIAAISAVENAKATVITILIATEASSVLRGKPMSSSQAAMAVGQKVRLFRRSCSFTVNIFFWSLTQFSLSTCCQTATDYCYNHSNTNNPVYRMAWEDLSLAQRKAAKSLGYKKKSWKIGDFDDSHKVWADLKSEDREAATMLGYTELSWNRVVRDAGD